MFSLILNTDEYGQEKIPQGKEFQVRNLWTF